MYNERTKEYLNLFLFFFVNYLHQVSSKNKFLDKNFTTLSFLRPSILYFELHWRKYNWENRISKNLKNPVMFVRLRLLT